VRKLSRNRKAVSSVFSTILMIMIVVVGMSVAFGYFVNFVKDYQTGRGGSVMEMVSIEDVWFKADHSTIELWLYNYGKVDVRINTFYIDGQLVTFNNLAIAVGTHANMNVNMTPGWTPKTVYHLKLVTDRGSVFEGKYASPDG
jgi:flagellin-like protein